MTFSAELPLSHPICQRRSICNAYVQCRFSVVRSYCGHGIGDLFHCPPSIPHYSHNKVRTRLPKHNAFAKQERSKFCQTSNTHRNPSGTKHPLLLLPVPASCLPKGPARPPYMTLLKQNACSLGRLDLSSSPPYSASHPRFWPFFL